MFENLPTGMASDKTVFGWVCSVFTFLFCSWIIQRMNKPSKRGRAGAKVKLISRGQALTPELDIDVDKTEPAMLRPFKPQYALTMALEKSSFQEWLLLENSYKSMTARRHEIAQKFPEHVNLAVNSKTTTEAVNELYDTVVGYLYTKWPQYFVKEGKIVKNLIKDTEFPANASKSKLKPKQLLEVLTENVEEDFIVLEYSDKYEEYVAQAATFIAPSGFVPAEKVGIRLTDIHMPVPKYDEKLKISMNRYFKRLEVGQLVKRTNWTVQNSAEFYLPKGSHATADEKLEKLNIKDLDFDSTMNLRVERQTLSRLPKSRFLVFTIRTYLTPLAQIKREGLGEKLVEGIAGLPPYIKQYKRAGSWGPAVKEYMSEA